MAQKTSRTPLSGQDEQVFSLLKVSRLVRCQPRRCSVTHDVAMLMHYSPDQALNGSSAYEIKIISTTHVLRDTRDFVDCEGMSVCQEPRVAPTLQSTESFVCLVRSRYVPRSLTRQADGPVLLRHRYVAKAAPMQVKV